VGALDRSVIGRAIKEIIDENNLEGYLVVRNERRNEDPSVAAQHKAWIGIYRSRVSYVRYTTGLTPWLATVETDVEIQCASMKDGESVEDALQAIEQEIIALLEANPTLKGTVTQIKEISAEDDVNLNTEVYFQAAIVTIKAEART
jgi:hypothetical protein